MTLREITIYLAKINDRLIQEVRLQAVFHRLPLPESGIAETAGKKRELSPDQEEKLQARLAAIKAQVQARFSAKR